MTREEAIKILTQYIDYDAETPDYYEMEKACKMAIEALEQQPCEDCISREPFTDSTICEGISCNECSFNRKDKGGCILEERVMKLPSIQPKAKTGHWIVVKTAYGKRLKCDKCEHYTDIGRDCKYCSNCGVKMESEDKE